jgi:GTP-binding protein
LTELGTYNPELLERPRLLLASKYDVKVAEIPDSCIPISSVTGYGLPTALAEIEQLVRHERSQTVVTSRDEVIHRPLPQGIQIQREGDKLFTVHGRNAERAVALNDLTNIEALQYVQVSLERLGVNKALKRAGVKEGDIVRIGELEFEFQEDGNFDF